jgi:hypothetical protein
MGNQDTIKAESSCKLGSPGILIYLNFTRVFARAWKQDCSREWAFDFRHLNHTCAYPFIGPPKQKLLTVSTG